MQLIIDTRETSLTMKDKTFLVANKSTSRQISPKRVSSIAITGNCRLSASAIKLAAQSKIPIYFFEKTGKLAARTWSPYFSNLADLRRRQLLFAEREDALRWVQSILIKKCMEQMITLERLGRRKTSALTLVKSTVNEINEMALSIGHTEGDNVAVVRNRLMGLEGRISGRYFLTLQHFLEEPFKTKSRTRRPAKDPFNAALNYLYGMTYSVVESGVMASGLDPLIGYLHVEGYVRRSLVFDLIEPFRPIVDRLLISLFTDKRLNTECFTNNKNGFLLGKAGKRVMIPAFNDYIGQYLLVGDKKMRLKDHIYHECRLLAKQLRGEL